VPGPRRVFRFRVRLTRESPHRSRRLSFQPRSISA